MEVIAYSEYEDECEYDPVELEDLLEHKIIYIDMQQMALLTLYADYQVQEAVLYHEGIEDLIKMAD